MSSDNRSRIALAYSVRFRRCRMNRPGLGLAAAERSIEISSIAIRLAASAFSGRGLPGGGIVPARNFRMTFSQISVFDGMLDKSALSSIKPAVRTRWLWQVTQYWSRRARGSAAAACKYPAAIPKAILKTTTTIGRAPMKEYIKAYVMAPLNTRNHRTQSAWGKLTHQSIVKLGQLPASLYV